MTTQAMPGVFDGRSVTPRRVMPQFSSDYKLQKAVIVDGDDCYDGANTSYPKIIRGGCFLAYNSTDAIWGPCKRSKANALGSSSTALTVDNATHFKAGDSIIVDNNTAQAIVSINYSTNVITLTSAISWTDNAQVYVDKYRTARGIMLDDEVQLYDDWAPTTYRDRAVEMLIAGYVDQDKVLGDIGAILEDPDSAFFCQNLVFDDYHDGTDTAPKPAGLFGLTKAKFITGNYTVVAADNGTMFYINAAATVTLPAKAVGLMFGFMNIADNTVVIASAGSADDIITDGDAGADTITFSTSSHKIGSALLVQALPDATKWATFAASLTTQTIA